MLMLMENNSLFIQRVFSDCCQIISILENINIGTCVYVSIITRVRSKQRRESYKMIF